MQAIIETIHSKLENAADGKVVGLEIPHTIHPLSCLENAIAAYRTYCAVRVTTSTPDVSLIDITVAPEYQIESKKIIWGFLTHLVALSSAAYLSE